MTEVVSFGAVRLVRVRDIERYVAREALLGSEPAPEPPYWMHLWPGARALARELASAAWLGGGSNLLELGCGLGLPSLVAAGRGARAWATDWKPDPLRLLGESARMNLLTVGTIQMDWSRPALRRCFDVCCGADVAYDQEAEGRLVDAAEALLRDGGRLMLADSVNIYRRTLPELLQARGFTVDEREVGEIEEGRNVWVRLLEARRTR